MSQLRTPVSKPPKAPAAEFHNSGLLEEDAHTKKGPALKPPGFKGNDRSPQKVVFGGKS